MTWEGRRTITFQKQTEMGRRGIDPGNFPWDSFAMERKELWSAPHRFDISCKSSQVTGRESWWPPQVSVSCMSAWGQRSRTAKMCLAPNTIMDYTNQLFRITVCCLFLLRLPRVFDQTLNITTSETLLCGFDESDKNCIACLEHFSSKLREIIMFYRKLISNEVYF